MANKNVTELSNSQAVDLVVGLTDKEAKDKLAKLGYTCIVQNLQQCDKANEQQACQLVVSCSLRGNCATIYLDNFILNPKGK